MVVATNPNWSFLSGVYVGLMAGVGLGSFAATVAYCWFWGHIEIVVKAAN